MSGIGNSYGFGGGLNGYGGGFGGGFGKGVNGFNSFDLSAYSLTGTKPAPNGPWGGKIGGGWGGKPGGPKQPIGKLPSPFPMPIVIPSKPKDQIYQPLAGNLFGNMGWANGPIYSVK